MSEVEKYNPAEDDQLNSAEQEHESTGVVYWVNWADGRKNIEVSFRDEQQGMPANAKKFNSESEMIEAIKEVANEKSVNLPQDIPFEGIWADVHSGIGHSYHPSLKKKELDLGDNVTMTIYRNDTNSNFGSPK